MTKGMKKLVGTLAALVASFGLVTPAGASPEPAEITEDTTWKRGSTIELERPVLVLDGATLTIEPGVQVQMGDLPFGSLSVVDGTLHAVGTEAEPIFFSGIALGLRGGSSPSDSVIRHAVVENTWSGMFLAGAPATVSDVTFTGNETALTVHNSPVDATFARNRFYSNQVAFKGRTSATISIVDSDFWDNDVNLWFLAQSPFECDAAPGAFEVHGNDILRAPDSEYFSFDVRTSDGSGDSGMTVDARDNWWGTTDPYDIAARTYRNFECCPGPSRAPVLWHAPATSPRTAAEPPGAPGTPPPEPEGHGDPVYVVGVTSPGHRDCRATPLRRIRGVAEGEFGEAPRVIEVAFVRRIRREICRSWHPNAGRFAREVTCDKRRYFERRVVDGKWTIPFERPLRPGRYTVYAGNQPGTTIVSFRILRARTTSSAAPGTSP